MDTRHLGMVGVSTITVSLPHLLSNQARGFPLAGHSLSLLQGWQRTLIYPSRIDTTTTHLFRPSRTQGQHQVTRCSRKRRHIFKTQSYRFPRLLHIGCFCCKHVICIQYQNDRRTTVVASANIRTAHGKRYLRGGICVCRGASCTVSCYATAFNITAHTIGRCLGQFYGLNDFILHGQSVNKRIGFSHDDFCFFRSFITYRCTSLRPGWIRPQTPVSTMSFCQPSALT